MARTGMKVTVTNTVLGGPPQVDANSMLVVVGAKATTGGTIAFSLDTPVLIQSVNDLDTLGISQENNPEVYKEVSDFFAPRSGVNTTGTILWLVGTEESANVKANLAGWVRSTVVNGFEYRPRQIAVSEPLAGEGAITQVEMQKVIDELYVEGFSTVAILGSQTIKAESGLWYDDTNLPDLSKVDAYFVGTCIVTDVQGGRACVGKLLGWLSTLSVGTSIGDGGSPAFASSMYFMDEANTPCSATTLETANKLGDKQYIFTRARPPKNGLWWNDGATAADPATSLSTLENGRTVASIVDASRQFFTPYINSKVPVNSSGDIDGTYKQVVLDNAREKVIAPYINAGDISDARLSLNAKNNDMIGTRTWEFTIEILDAPTLRWLDGYVFYVKSL